MTTDMENKSNTIKYYLLTTGIVWAVCWMGLAACSHLLDISLTNNPVMYIPYLIGGFSPTIGSYAALKRSGTINGIRDWLLRVFDVKKGRATYVFIPIFLLAFFVPQCIISGYDSNVPLVAGFINAIFTLFMGGLEEPGWRGVLHPELENRFGFIKAVIIVVVIWWLWHLPLFLIKGSPNAEHINYFLYGLSFLGMTPALAAVYKSGGVFPCILLHTLINSFSGVYLIHYSILGLLAMSFCMILVSGIMLKLFHSLNAKKSVPIENRVPYSD